MAIKHNEPRIKKLITGISIAVPLVVALLFGVKIPNTTPLYFLPPIYATINGVTALILLSAVWAIKQGKRELHRKLMNVCIGLSVAFLLMYIAYHMTAPPTPFGGTGIIRYVYYIILISHIVLSIAVIPMVLHTYARAYLGKFDAHRKLAKLTFPIWFYVAVTGVVVYVLISPYYPL